jgi:hypothetical protein
MQERTNMTWIVICPKWSSNDHVNKAHGWSLSQEELAKVEKSYFDSVIECIVCHHNFSLQQGVREAFSTDIPFVIHSLQYNANENGEVEITSGQLKNVKFSEAFEDTPKIYLTPHEPVNAVPGHITNTQFTIFSSDSRKEGETRKIGWAAYGNRSYATIPVWRKLLSNSKEHQLRKDYRPELVDLESAFEVFIIEYLSENLGKKLKDETINWILNRSIEEVLKIGFIELNGKPLSELEKIAHERWRRNVKKLRDSVVHRGASVTDQQAREAREAMFDLMTKVDHTVIDYFRIQMKEVRLKNPNVTFGIAMIEGAGFFWSACA